MWSQNQQMKISKVSISFFSIFQYSYGFARLVTLIDVIKYLLMLKIEIFPQNFSLQTDYRCLQSITQPVPMNNGWPSSKHISLSLQDEIISNKQLCSHYVSGDK